MERKSTELPRQQLFTNKVLAKLMIPLFLETALGVLVGMVDGVMVSSVGEAAISGVALVGNISNVLVYVYAALTTGGAVVTSHFLGAGKKEEARHSAGQLITMTAAVSLGVMIFCLLFSRRMLRLLFGNIEQDVMEAAVTYFAYSSLSFPFMALRGAGAAIFRCNGDSKVSLYASMVTNLVNVAGNAICVYGLKMGVEGVAIPTLLSRIVGMAVIVGALMSKKQPLRPNLRDIFRLDPKIIKRVARIGIPSGFESGLFHMGRVLTLSMISCFGTYQIAANSTANTLTSIVVIVPSTLINSSITVIGQCVGARDEAQVYQNFKKMMSWCYIFNGIAAVLLMLLRYQFIGLYDSLAPETVELTSTLMCIFLIPSILIYPLSFLVPGCLRATGDSAFPMWVSIISMLVFRLGLAQILCVNMGLGAPGVWIAMVVDWAIRSVCFSWRWFRGGWKKKCGLE